MPLYVLPIISFLIISIEICVDIAKAPALINVELNNDREIFG